MDEIARVDLAIEAEIAIHELKIGSQRTNVRLQVLATVSATAVDRSRVRRPDQAPGSDALHAW